MARDAIALEPDQIALVVNKNVPASTKLAEFYTRARQIPSGRIIALDLPGGEEMPFDDYQRKVVAPIRDFLRRNGLREKVTCLVTFYGVPFRVHTKELADPEKQELTELKTELDRVQRDIVPVVSSMEKLAKEFDEKFQNSTAADVESLGRRADAAIQVINAPLPLMTEAAKRQGTEGKLLDAVERLAGPIAVVEKLSSNEIAAEAMQSSPEQVAKWDAVKQRVTATTLELERLEDHYYDADARAALRLLVKDNYGLFTTARLVRGQIDYLTSDGSCSALDNELALLWWNFYNRPKWVMNPLYWRVRGVMVTPHTLMVMRLDGPQEGTARDIIVSSLKAEKEGLKGRVVLDSRGIGQHESAYGEYDETIRRLAQLVGTRTKLQVILDEKPAVFPPNSVKGVALYCGWYSLRRYVPSFQFNPGAVGFHIASLEMVGLRSDHETGWVHGLLNDGVACTLGPVAEPYLHSFPKADEFFALLLTGKMTLAEVYWSTTPLTSWMICAIGDPLYMPYKTSTPLAVEELPDGMAHRLFGVGAPPPPATQPATEPAEQETPATIPAQ